jgi:hypothetical protein
MMSSVLAPATARSDKAGLLHTASSLQVPVSDGMATDAAMGRSRSPAPPTRGSQPSNLHHNMSAKILPPPCVHGSLQSEAGAAKSGASKVATAAGGSLMTTAAGGSLMTAAGGSLMTTAAGGSLKTTASGASLMTLAASVDTAGVRMAASQVQRPLTQRSTMHPYATTATRMQPASLSPQPRMATSALRQARAGPLQSSLTPRPTISGRWTPMHT